MSKTGRTDPTKRQSKKIATPHRVADPAQATGLDLSRRNELIALSAYFRAQTRGFAPGHELEDWLASEAEVLHSFGIAPGSTPATCSTSP